MVKEVLRPVGIAVFFSTPIKNSSPAIASELGKQSPTVLTPKPGPLLAQVKITIDKLLPDPERTMIMQGPYPHGVSGAPEQLRTL